MEELFHGPEYIIVVYSPDGGVDNSSATVFLNKIIPPQDPISEYGLGGAHCTEKEEYLTEVSAVPENARNFCSRVKGIGYTTRGVQTENTTRGTVLMHASWLQDFQDLCYKTIPRNNATDTVIPGRPWMLS